MISELNRASKVGVLCVRLFTNEYLRRIIEIIKNRFYLINSYSTVYNDCFPTKIGLTTVFLNESMHLRKCRMFELISYSRRYRYTSVAQLKLLRGVYLVNTAKLGLLISSDCIKNNCGGQLVCRIRVK